MKLTEKSKLKILEPAKGKYLKHRKTGQVFESKIYLGKGDSKKNYKETDEKPEKQETTEQQNVEERHNRRRTS